MTDLTAETASQLRKPFPATAIGKLPKPHQSTSQKGNCKECGGYHGLPAVHLDYVGHAATTDRLLSVDPAWSWEPFALDLNGLPALDGRGNLWIRLTVCGVTRIGVGDGKNAKEIIGDAIRNAAMRFGVALDLWGKEELEQAHAPARPLTIATPVAVTADDFAPRAPEPPDDPAPTRRMSRSRNESPDGITSAQSAALHASFSGAGITDRDTRLAYCRNLIGRDVTSSNELSRTEASRCIDALEGP